MAKVIPFPMARVARQHRPVAFAFIADEQPGESNAATKLLLASALMALVAAVALQLLSR